MSRKQQSIRTTPGSSKFKWRWAHVPLNCLTCQKINPRLYLMLGMCYLFLTFVANFFSLGSVRCWWFIFFLRIFSRFKLLLFRHVLFSRNQLKLLFFSLQKWWLPGNNDQLSFQSMQVILNSSVSDAWSPGRVMSSSLKPIMKKRDQYFLLLPQGLVTFKLFCNIFACLHL